MPVIAGEELLAAAPGRRTALRTGRAPVFDLVLRLAGAQRLRQWPQNPYRPAIAISSIPPIYDGLRGPDTGPSPGCSGTRRRGVRETPARPARRGNRAPTGDGAPAALAQSRSPGVASASSVKTPDSTALSSVLEAQKPSPTCRIRSGVGCSAALFSFPIEGCGVMPRVSENDTSAGPLHVRIGCGIPLSPAPAEALPLRRRFGPRRRHAAHPRVRDRLAHVLVVVYEQPQQDGGRRNFRSEALTVLLPSTVGYAARTAANESFSHCTTSAFAVTFFSVCGVIPSRQFAPPGFTPACVSSQ